MADRRSKIHAKLNPQNPRDKVIIDWLNQPDISANRSEAVRTVLFDHITGGSEVSIDAEFLKKTVVDPIAELVEKLRAANDTEIVLVEDGFSDSKLNQAFLNQLESFSETLNA